MGRFSHLTEKERESYVMTRDEQNATEPAKEKTRVKSLNKRRRDYIFVINNYTFTDLDQVLALDAKFLCFGFEIGEETHTPHIQGYVYFTDAKTQSSVVKMLPRASLRFPDGTPEQNLTYVSKPKTKEDPDDWWQFGELPQQGRASWDKIEEAMKNPRDNISLFTQYRKSYKEIITMKDRRRQKEVYLLSCTDVYDEADKYAQVYINIDCTDNSERAIDCYDDEDVAILLGNHCLTWIHPWHRGYPHKFRRGYEIKTVDPTILYVVYRSMDERKLYSKILKDYLNI